jgi:hypothetical protein
MSIKCLIHQVPDSVTLIRLGEEHRCRHGAGKPFAPFLNFGKNKNRKRRKDTKYEYQILKVFEETNSPILIAPGPSVKLVSNSLNVSL